MFSVAIDSTPIGGEGHPAVDPATGRVLLWRGPRAPVTVPWRASQAGVATRDATWRNSPTEHLDREASWSEAGGAVIVVGLGMRALSTVASARPTAWGTSGPAAIAAPGAWANLSTMAAARVWRWGGAGQESVEIRGTWTSLRGDARAVALPSREAEGFRAAWEAPWRPAAPLASPSRPARWRAARRIPWGGAIIIIPPPGGGDGGTDPNRRTWRIYLRRTYMLNHSISLVRVSDGAEIPVNGIEFQQDASNPHITFRAELAGPSLLPLVKPGEDGEPVVLECTIDGASWRVMVEEMPEGLRPRGYRIPISGRSLSARLASPYRMPVDRASASSAALSQLALDELPIDGWALAWTAANPTVPAGAWSLRQASPVAALQRLAEAVGGVVVASDTAQGFAVQPWYPVLPWDYGTAAPDLIVPYGALLAGSTRDSGAALARRNGANGVWLYGGSVGGVLGRVYREISTGDRLAADVQDDLLCDSEALYARGARVLAGQFRPDFPTLVLPLGGGSFPLARMGWLVRVDTDDGPSYGTVSGVSWSVSLSGGGGQPAERQVRQTIRLGEDTGNALATFRALVPPEPRLRGVVLSKSGNSALVELAGGGRQTIVLGGVSAGVGDAVWFRDGAALGTAPTMTEYQVPV